MIEPGERAMIAGVMRLGDRPVRGVMTPRREVDMVDLRESRRTSARRSSTASHSRLPAHEGVPDDMLGVIQAKDLLDAYMAGERPDVRAHVRAAPTVSDTADALDVLNIINQSPVHIALVHDEYGHFEGIVTNADILEAIIGASRTDEGPAEPDAVQRDDGSWLIAGYMPADEMADRLAITIPQERAYHTAAGFVLNRSATCRRSASPSTIRAGASRSSISTAAASTRFWRRGYRSGGCALDGCVKSN